VTDVLLPWYNRELEYFRQLAGEFAGRYPKIAARLSLDQQGARDPHVERMIQAFAYLNARIRYKLDDDFPEIADALLSVLYPHYLAPIPSMSVVEFQLKKGQADLPRGHGIPAGTMLETEPVDGERCQFRTCYTVRLWPFQVGAAALESRPFSAPATSRSGQAQAQLRMELRLTDKSQSFRQLPLDRLRFYLHGPSFQHACTLHELLLNEAIEVVLANSPTDPHPVVLPPAAIQSVGFARDDAILPDLPRTFPGYRLLTEFFSFPRKYLFVDLAGLSPSALQGIGQTLYIFISLKNTDGDLERTVSTDFIRLGCTPAINLFPHPADPFELTHRQTEYRVIPDARRENALEVYSISDVMLSDSAGKSRPLKPFYSIEHADADSSPAAYWHAVRRPGPVTGEGQFQNGSEMYLSFVDPAFSPLALAEETVHVSTMCFNRDLPGRLPSGGGRPRFTLREGDEKIGQIVSLAAPTATLRPSYRRGNLWKLVSHLSLNHLSIEGGAAGATALREILKLYNWPQSSETQDLIDAVINIERRPSVARVGGAPSGFCRGIDLELTFNFEKLIGQPAYLFANVLEQFLGMSVNLNSFTRVSIKKQKSHGITGKWAWPPRSGERVLL
jgi:type VI secretion system protein ImpG